MPASLAISAVLATYNRRELLKLTLPSLLAQQFEPVRCDIVIVVDGSTDGTLKWLRSLNSKVPVTVIEQPNRGLAAARNAGLAAAGGELVVFLDDDLRCAPSLLREHVRAHSREKNIVAFGPVLLSDESPRTVTTSWMRQETDRKTARLSGKAAPMSQDQVALSANCSARRSALLAAGGFDERFVGGCEEFEFGWRLKKAGVEFRYLPSAVTTQLYHKHASQVVKDAFRKGRNEVIFCKTHPDYRRTSPLARAAEGSTPMRVARRAALQSPLSPEPLLRIPFSIAARFSRFEPAQRAAIRLLGFRMGTAMFRGAMRETGSRREFKQAYELGTPALTYHHIGGHLAGAHPLMTVAPVRFEQQMRWLADRGYAAISPAEWIAWRDEGQPLPDKPVLITLDDGYADTATYAVPILKKYGFKATIYIVTGQVGGVNEWDTSAGFAQVNYPLMTADQIRQCQGEGLDFGAHSRSHPDLTTLETGALEDETIGSANDLEKLLGVRPVSFAYPYGRHDARVVELVRNAYSLGLTCDEGLNYLNTDRPLIRRVMILPGDSMVEFSMRVRLGYSPLVSLRQLRAYRLARTSVGHFVHRFLKRT